MVYIYEIELKKSDRIDRGIKRIFGLDPKTLRSIFFKIKKAPRSRGRDCDGETIEKVTNFFRDSGKFGSFLKLENKENIERLRKINSYRGIRLSEGKPVRGQRTHTNAKTSRRARFASIYQKKRLQSHLKQKSIKKQNLKKPIKKQQQKNNKKKVRANKNK